MNMLEPMTTEADPGQASNPPQSDTFLKAFESVPGKVFRIF